MDFKIDKNQASGISPGETVRIRAGASDQDTLRSLLDKAPSPARKAELEAFGKDTIETGDTLVISNIKNAIGVANNAIAKMEELKKQQLYLAREGADLPTLTARHATLEAENAAISNAISDVSNTAVYNGISVLKQSQTYTVKDIDAGIANAIGTGNTRISETGGTSSYTPPVLTDQSLSSTGETQAERDLVILRNAKAGYGAAAKKASEIYPKERKEALPLKNDSPDALRSEQEAKSLAGELAQRISAAGKSDQSAAALVEASTSQLSLSRVKDLLS